MQSPRVAQEVERMAVARPLADAWAADLGRSIFGNRFMGLTMIQFPEDVQIFHEIIWSTRPEVIVECGAFGGGFTLWLAAQLEACGIDGRVVSIDIEDRLAGARERDVWQRRVTFIHGSTTDPAVVDAVEAIRSGRPTMVILDSDHRADHVRAELDAYAGMVTPGCYLVVQDGLVEELVPDHGPGPLAALDDFLAVDDRFEIDRDCQRLILTAAPSGWLRRR